MTHHIPSVGTQDQKGLKVITGILQTQVFHDEMALGNTELIHTKPTKKYHDSIHAPDKSHCT
jgi:hypothetical protein